MLTIIRRILMILLVAGVVALGWYGISTTSAAESLLSGRHAGPPGRGQFQGAAPQTVADSTGQQRMPPGDLAGAPPRDAGNTFSLTRALPGMTKNLGLTMVMTVAVVLLRRFARVRRSA
jgi:hypothetical protein